jgi:hypothetical protein
VLAANKEAVAVTKWHCRQSIISSKVQHPLQPLLLLCACMDMRLIDAAKWHSLKGMRMNSNPGSCNKRLSQKKRHTYK